VRQLLDPVLVERDQAVEAVGESDVFGGAAEVVPVLRARLGPEQLVELLAGLRA
jgi:hypothetical protein